MNLARNIPIYQVPDTDDESLELILGLISERPRKRWVDEIKAHQASPIVASGPQRLPMILRNTAFMVELVHLYPYSRHWSETIKISLFHKWRKSIFPVRIYLLDLLRSLTQFYSTSKRSSGKASWSSTSSRPTSTFPAKG